MNFRVVRFYRALHGSLSCHVKNRIRDPGSPLVDMSNLGFPEDSYSVRAYHPSRSKSFQTGKSGVGKAITQHWHA